MQAFAAPLALSGFAFTSAPRCLAVQPARLRNCGHRPSQIVAATATSYGIESPGVQHVIVRDGLPFEERARKYAEDGLVPEYCVNIFLDWYKSYARAVSESAHVQTDPREYTEAMFSTLLELSRRHVENPLNFDSYHMRMREPFDYYRFGLEFARVLVDISTSRVLGQENLRKAYSQTLNGDNVIFLANHQSEGDPFAIDVLFDKLVHLDPQFCGEMIFMAGDRVREDPVVAPFSIGRNLLTVYSKKHINDVPELRSQKLKHNRKTISVTHSLFHEGGKCVWFAPAGGRDRRSRTTGRVEISSFDPDAVDVMRITAQKSGKPCHFYPMSLLTYDLLPPPSSVGGAELGEARMNTYGPMHIAVGNEIDWTYAEPASITDKLEKRKYRAQYVEQKVREGYAQICGDAQMGGDAY